MNSLMPELEFLPGRWWVIRYDKSKRTFDLKFDFRLPFPEQHDAPATERQQSAILTFYQREVSVSASQAHALLCYRDFGKSLVASLDLSVTPPISSSIELAAASFIAMRQDDIAPAVVRFMGRRKSVSVARSSILKFEFYWLLFKAVSDFESDFRSFWTESIGN